MSSSGSGLRVHDDERLRRARERDVERAQALDPLAPARRDRGRLDEHDAVELEALRGRAASASGTARRARRTPSRRAPAAPAGASPARSAQFVPRAQLRPPPREPPQRRARRRRPRRSAAARRRRGTRSARATSGAISGSSGSASSITSRGTRYASRSSATDTSRPSARCGRRSSQRWYSTGPAACAMSPRIVIAPVVRRASIRSCIGVRSCASSTITCPCCCGGPSRSARASSSSGRSAVAPAAAAELLLGEHAAHELLRLDARPRRGRRACRGTCGSRATSSSNERNARSVELAAVLLVQPPRATSMRKRSRRSAYEAADSCASSISAATSCGSR